MTIDTFAFNVGTAVLLGVAIGLERQWGPHAAGLRVNALVALGAALFVGLSFMVERDSSPTRIAAQIVSGLGFLGGGVILREGLNVKGLNTAATIWCSGAVGALAGAGHPLEAAIGASCVLLVHIVLRPVSNWIESLEANRLQIETCYRLRIDCSPEHDAILRHTLLRHVGDHPKLRLHGLATEERGSQQLTVIADIFSPERNDRALEEIVARVSIEPEVKAVSWKQTIA